MQRPVLSIFVLLVGTIVGTLCHVPTFPYGNVSPDTAYPVTDPAKSWAFYDSLNFNETKYFKFTMYQQAKMSLRLLTTIDPLDDPLQVSMLIHSLGVKDMTTDMISSTSPYTFDVSSLPSTIDFPDINKGIIVDGLDPKNQTVVYEGFGPSNYRVLSQFDVVPPPYGEYYVVVYLRQNQSNIPDNGFHYCLVIGYEESYSAAEVILTPFITTNIWRWQRQSNSTVFVPVLLPIIAGLVIVIVLRAGFKKRPHTLFEWLLSLAGILFGSTALTIMVQMGISSGKAGAGTEAVGVTIVYFVLSLCYATAALLIVQKPERIYTQYEFPNDRSGRFFYIGKRIALIGWGFLSLFTWSGWVAGPCAILFLGILPTKIWYVPKSTEEEERNYKDLEEMTTRN